MSDSIPLHPEKGVNPHLTFCPRCGGEASELVLVGATDTIYECPQEHKILGRPKNNVCPTCGHATTFTVIRKLEDHERLPARQPCDRCQTEMKEFEKVIAEGGIYIQCKDCGMKGVLKANHPLCAEVRGRMNIPTPGPIGVELTKNECPKCGEAAAGAPK